MAIPALTQFALCDLLETYERIKTHIVHTPVVTNDYLSSAVSKAAGHNISLYFKAELLQPTGSCKIRGSFNAVLSALSESGGKLRGVVTCSSGNHGAATAYAAHKLGIGAVIVVPSNARKAKKTIIAAYGAEVIVTSESSMDAIMEMCQLISKARNYALIYPHDQTDIISGLATCGIEFMQDVPQLDAIIVPVSGGSVASGVCIGAKHMKPDIKVFGVAPAAKQLGHALSQRMPSASWSSLLDTKCDALTANPGQMTFPLLTELLEEEVFDVTDDEAMRAMETSWHQLKLTVEISSATVISGILSPHFARVASCHQLRHVGLILTGGNVDIAI